jgi:MFS family permease
MVYGCNTCVNCFGHDCMTFPIDAILISSPIIGGVLSSPAVRWPNTLGKLSYLRDHPYFLPCFIPSILAFVAFLGALVGLKEVFVAFSSFLHFSDYVQTLPSAVLQQRHRKEKMWHHKSTSTTSLLEDRDAFHYRSIEDNTHHSVGSRKKSEIPQPPPLLALLTPRVLAVAINQGFVCFCDISMQVLMPLMWSTSLEHGGLGFTPYTIGLTLGIFGVVNVVIQVMFLGKLIRRFGPRKVLIVSFPAFLVSLACFPLEGCLARQTGGADWRVWTVIMVHLVMDSLKHYCYGELKI